MRPDEFLEIVNETLHEDRDRVRLGVVDSVMGSRATIQFDNESIPSTKSYLSVNYSPVVGDRVALLRTGHSWLIVGAVGVGSTGGDHPDSDHTTFAPLDNWRPTALSVTGDWNDVVESGVYKGNGLLNASPFATHSWRYCFVIRHSPDYVLQIQADYNHPSSNAGSGGVAVRRLLAGIWRPWSLLGGEDSGWVELSITGADFSAYQTGLGNSWTPRYRRVNGTVYMEGLVNGGPTGVCAYLPTGFRPGTGASMRNVVTAAGHYRLDISSNGAINFVTGWPDTTSWKSISASFPQEN